MKSTLTAPVGIPGIFECVDSALRSKRFEMLPPRLLRVAKRKRSRLPYRVARKITNKTYRALGLPI